MTFFIVLPVEGALNQSGQLVYGAVHGLVRRPCLVNDRNGPETF